MSAAIVSQFFLSQCPEDERAHLLEFLPTQEIEEIIESPLPEKDLLLGFSLPEDALPKIHFSWLAPYLRALPETEIRLFLSSLSDAQIKGLKEKLLFSEGLPTLSPLGKEFLQKTLFASLSTHEILSIDLLPPHPCNKLLSLSQEGLLRLIDLLSMHDLSIEIRHIIDTVKLKKIYSILSKPQGTYLKTLSYKKEPVAFKPLGLAHWNGDAAALCSLLAQRGLNRLAKALFLCNKSLVWYVSHQLDVERGLRLTQLCTPLDHKSAAPILLQQVIELLEAQEQT